MKDIFFESIRCKNGEVHNINFHNHRVNQTRKEVFGIHREIDLSDYIKIPDSKFYKCRVEYGEKINSIEFIEYNIEKKKKFKMIKVDDNVDYTYKTTKRKFIEEAFKQRGDCDDIIMIRGGYLTDSSVANIACYIEGKWITPSNPISKGTTRSRLLKEEKIIESDVMIRDIQKIEKFALMNALFGFLEIEDFEIIN